MQYFKSSNYKLVERITKMMDDIEERNRACLNVSTKIQQYNTYPVLKNK